MEHLRTVHYDPYGLVIHANGKKLRPTRRSDFDIGDRVMIDGDIITGPVRVFPHHDKQDRVEFWQPERQDTEQ